MYLVDNKLEDFDDNDVCEINDRVFPGQTLMSIKRFVKSVKGWQSQKIQTYQDKSLSRANTIATALPKYKLPLR